MKINTAAFEAFKKSFPNPPLQGAVGAAPSRYFSELPKDESKRIEESIARLPARGEKPLSRKEVRSICRETALDPLVVYCVVMAWGGRNLRNFRLSLESATALKQLITTLRQSTRSRAEDFARAQKECSSIKGLKISFYSKLLYFMRPEPDAYILDRWTARSAKFLFPEGKIQITSQGFPSPKTGANDYDWFCSSLDKLAKNMDGGWESGEAIERALFDRRSGRWRAQIPPLPGESFPKVEAPGGDIPPVDPPVQNGEQGNNGDENHNRRLALANLLAHIYNMQDAHGDGMDLPSTGTTVQVGAPNQETRVHCRHTQGVTWQFKVQLTQTYPQIFFSGENGLNAFQNLGVEGNGGAVQRINGVACEGANAPIEDWPVNAQRVVQSMSDLWEEHGEALP